MRPEKKYLVQEVSDRLKESDYMFLTNYYRITVSETAELRAKLAEQEAEFHVVKNTILQQAAKSLDLPELDEMLDGPIAVVSGGRNPSEVAKILQKFHQDKEKVEIKGGALGERLLTPDEIDALSKLPSLDSLRAQLIGLLNTPAQQLVGVMNAVPTSVVNVLKAYSDKEAA
ncbi:MAG: 50S ribosomal protein L10 [Opitutales bacterium]|nr:50S ribosomal protein L10 [Opitutales bacterium]